MPALARRHLIPIPFQSAPGREAGRCAACTFAAFTSDCFNPRPAVRPGDADVESLAPEYWDVSIRARP